MAVSVLLHALVLWACVSWGQIGTEMVETPPTILVEFSLGGLSGRGGVGGDGLAPGSAAAGPQSASQETAAEASQPSQSEVSEPTPPASEAEAEPPQPTPVASEKSQQPEKKTPPVQPEAKAKPKPVRKVAKASPKPPAPQPVAESHPTQLAAVAAPTSAATNGSGNGTGLGQVGQGPGKGPGQGDGPPGVGGGLGGSGGGSDTGLFGHGNGPHFRHRHLPRYPSQAKMENKEGSVSLRLSIDEDGTLRDVDVVKHDGLEFVQSVLQAIRASTFFPAVHLGKPIRSRALLVIHFKLG